MTNGAFCLGRYRYVDCERMDFIATRRTVKRGKELSPEECRKLRMELSIPKFVTIGDGELTEEEKEEAYTHKMLEKVMHEFGTLAPDKHLTDDEDVQNNEDGDSKK